jgi:hypothetical protein
MRFSPFHRTILATVLAFAAAVASVVFQPRDVSAAAAPATPHMTVA